MIRAGATVGQARKSDLGRPVKAFAVDYPVACQHLLGIRRRGRPSVTTGTPSCRRYEPFVSAQER